MSLDITQTGIEAIPVYKASLRILVDIEENIERLEFDYDKNSLRVHPKQLQDKDKTQGLQEALTQDVSITCLKDLTQNQEINIYAYPKMNDDAMGPKHKDEPHQYIPAPMLTRKLAGRILLLRNDTTIRKKLQITVVKVTTKIEEVKIGDFSPKERGVLYNVLHQALIVPEIRIIEMDLSRDFTTGKSYITSDGKISPNIEFWNKLRQASRNINGLAVFCFDVIGHSNDDDKILAGKVEKINSNFVTVFKDRKNETLSHEILHALGLYHTHRDDGRLVQPNQKFVFKKETTDNIMSYSDKRKTTWYWQWKLINPKIK